MKHAKDPQWNKSVQLIEGEQEYYVPSIAILKGKGHIRLATTIETQVDTTPLNLATEADPLRYANDQFRDLAAVCKVKNATEADLQIQIGVDPLQGGIHLISGFCAYNLVIKSK
jgi:hypothetical protein